MLLVVETRVLQKRVQSKIEAKFCIFTPVKYRDGWAKRLNEFCEFSLGPIVDIVRLTGRCSTVWETRVWVSKKKGHQQNIKGTRQTSGGLNYWWDKVQDPPTWTSIDRDWNKLSKPLCTFLHHPVQYELNSSEVCLIQDVLFVFCDMAFWQNYTATCLNRVKASYYKYMYVKKFFSVLQEWTYSMTEILAS